MNLVGMEMFARVVEAKSFSGAAVRLKVSKSVVSKQVTRLERSIGAQLLHRNTRSISVTEVGREFYGRCREVLAAAERAELAACHLQAAPRGTLRVASPVSIGMLHLAPALAALVAACPDLCVELTLTNRDVHVVEEGYDVSIVVGDDLRPGLVARHLTWAQRHLCASPTYFERAGRPESLKDLRDHNCLVYTGVGRENGARWRFTDASDDAVVVEVKGNLHINNLSAIRVAALAGVGIAILPGYIVRADLARGELVEAPLQQCVPVPTAVHAVFPPNRHPAPKVRAFIDCLLARFASPQSRGALE